MTNYSFAEEIYDVIGVVFSSFGLFFTFAVNFALWRDFGCGSLSIAIPLIALLGIPCCDMLRGIATRAG